MPERVQVVVEAKDAASGVLRALTSQLGAFGGLMEELTAKDISWGNVTQQAALLVINGMKEAVNATLQYAGEVRELSMISGETTEETSRFIQVLDDYKIGADDALAATRALTKEGYSPSIETLAQLSDQYLALNSSQERNEFILKNLGRSGLQWVEVLNQGSDAIRAQGAAVDDSLILTQKAVDQAREYEMALDDWNDSIQALKISIGNALLPVMTDLIDRQMAMQNVQEQIQDMPFWERPSQFSQDWYDMVDAEEANIKAQRELKLAADDTTGSLDTQKQAVEELSKELTTILSLTVSLASENDNYTDSMDRLAQQQEQVAAEIQTATAQYGASSQQVADLQTKYNDLGMQMQDTAEKHTEAVNTIIYNNLMAKLSVDGLTQAEFEMAQQAGVALGIYTQAQADQAVAINTLTQQLADGQITIEQFNQAVADGSYVVQDSNTTISQSSQEMETKVTDSATGAGDSAKELATTISTMSTDSKAALDASADAWYQYKLDVVVILNALIQKTRDYIAVLNQIPTEIYTEITQNYVNTGDPPASASVAGAGLNPGGGAGVTSNVTNNSFYGAYITLAGAGEDGSVMGIRL